MATTFVSTDTIVNQNITDGDDIYIYENVSLTVDGDDAITGTDANRVYILGNVYGENAYDGDNTSLYVTIGESGDVATEVDAFNIEASSTVRFYNHGNIHADDDAIDIEESGTTANVYISNLGYISAGDDGITSDMNGATTYIDNSGIIVANDNGVNSYDGTLIVYNSGQIISKDRAINSGSGAQSVYNSGLMDGDIEFGAGRDFYDARAGGEISGTIYGEEGNDTLLGGSGTERMFGGQRRDLLNGNDGDDQLFGEDGMDTVSGGAGDDTVRGGRGDDTLRAGEGNDIVGGGAGSDFVRAQAGDDSIRGSGGRDTLHGGSGEDSLDGGKSRDTLDGGLGDDLLTGGDGADTFVFTPSSGHDTITDFENGVDKIDISAFGLDRSDFSELIEPALSRAGANKTLLDFDEIGDLGEGNSVVIEGLAFVDANVRDFIF